MKRYMSSSNMGATQLLLKKLLPLDLENFLSMSFRSFSHWWFDGFKWYLVYRCIMKRYRSSSNMGAAQLFLEKLLPLDLENFLKITVSVHFVIDGLMDSKYIWYTGVSRRDAGEVQIWVRSNYYWRSYCPCTKKMYWKILIHLHSFMMADITFKKKINFDGRILYRWRYSCLCMQAHKDELIMPPPPWIGFRS